MSPSSINPLVIGAIAGLVVVVPVYITVAISVLRSPRTITPSRPQPTNIENTPPTRYRQDNWLMPVPPR
jgi:hypothetical protein